MMYESVFDPASAFFHLAHIDRYGLITCCGQRLMKDCPVTLWTSHGPYACRDCHKEAMKAYKHEPFTEDACLYCGLSKQDAPNVRYIEEYNILLKSLIHLNIIHPETRTRLEDPAGEHRIAYNDDWVNRIVARVVRLRVTREDEGAKAIVDMGMFLEGTGTFFYRCVCLRSSGVKEGPEGELI